MCLTHDTSSQQRKTITKQYYRYKYKYKTVLILAATAAMSNLATIVQGMYQTARGRRTPHPVNQHCLLEILEQRDGLDVNGQTAIQNL